MIQERTPAVVLSITLLLLWCSHITAAVPLSLGCCMRCMAPSYRCCCASLASLRLWRSPLRPLLLLYRAGMALLYCCCLATLTWLAGAVAHSHRCCCGALASLLLCRSCVTAAVRSLHRGCHATLAHHCCCATLASPLLWRSRITAAMALSRGCRRAALAFITSLFNISQLTSRANPINPPSDC